MSTETDQAAAREALALYPFDGSDPNLILALHAAFRAGAEFAAEHTPAPAPSEAADTVATPPVMRIEGTWLAEFVDEHTCGAGPGSGTGMHEPGCGLVPVLDLATLPGWGEHLTADPSATREELSALLLTFLRPPKHGGSWTYSPDEAADALLARFNITPKEDR